MKRIKIKWVDAHSQDEWTTFKKLNRQSFMVTTIGYLVFEDDSTVCIASSRNKKTKQFCCTMVIPKACILKRKEV